MFPLCYWQHCGSCYICSGSRFRQLRLSLGPWCCPHWEVSDSSGQRSLTPGHCWWTGWFWTLGLRLWTRRPGCCLVVSADRGCRSGSAQCNPEECWPQRGRHRAPTLWNFHDQGSPSVPLPTPAVAPIVQFSVDIIKYWGYSRCDDR